MQVEVGGLGVELLADAQRPLLELEPAPLEPAPDDLHVAAVGVDREVLGVELAEHELHAAASSQYGRASPRLAATPLQLEHRRVGRQHVAGAAGGELGEAVERLRDVGHDLDRGRRRRPRT